MPRKRILIITVKGYEPPDTLQGLAEEDIHPIKTDFDVATGLKQLGHKIRVLGLADDITQLHHAIHDFKPDVVFNLLEHFNQRVALMPYVLGYLELAGVPYTGCNPIGMVFSNDKARQRKILRHHRIPCPAFFTVAKGQRPRRPKRLDFPLIVKSLTEHGSAGIAEASVVHTDEKLAERAEHVHDTVGTDAIVEQFIKGREIYCSVLGNKRLTTFPLWELSFENLRDDAPVIVTERLKWNVRRQKATGIDIQQATLNPALEKRITHDCKRAYRALEQNGYARFDLRLTDDDRFYIIESNPNPQLAFDEEFAESAAAAGIPYHDLLSRIINLALRSAKR